MSNEDPADKGSTTRTDLLLSSMYFYFAEKVWGGLSEASVRKINWYLPRKKINYEARLDSLLRAPGGISEVGEPVYRQYGFLKKALEKYQAIANANEWPVIVIDKKSYTRGDSANPIAIIKKRLYLLGDMTAASETPIFDSTLAVAVNKFRRRFGMKETGIIDQPVINELNVPIKKRVEQIIVNIERSRWLPDHMEGDFIAVNIPEFKLHVCHGDSVLWSMNVVVGKAANKTVIFSGDLKYVVFSPYWNVPTSILNKEVLPGIRKNSNYLATHHMEWNGKSVRQKPGPWNALGQVKFLFPNSYSIYLHDTPSKSLFTEDKRAFSHGCIRVGEPGKLAQHLLQNEALWTDRKIDQAMNSGKEQYVTLKQPVPVFIGYLTAWVDLQHQNELNFRNDVYGRDGRLAKMLEK
jgi:murein L,D-transpeptidase YcbB/YkuD